MDDKSTVFPTLVKIQDVHNGHGWPVDNQPRVFVCHGVRVGDTGLLLAALQDDEGRISVWHIGSGTRLHVLGGSVADFLASSKLEK